MHEGFAIVCSPSGYGPYVRIGYLRRIAGDEWEICHARVIRRFGEYAALAGIATTGPIETTELLVASKEPEPLHRLHALRVVYANAEVWKYDLAKGWKE